MKEMYKYFIKRAEKILANDEYISDGIILLRKKYIDNKILNYYKNGESELNEVINEIPFYRGEDIDITQINTKCILASDYNILICIDGYSDIYVNYEFIKIFEQFLCFSCLYYTIVKTEKGYFIKVFDDNDDFVGGVMTIEGRTNYDKR